MRHWLILLGLFYCGTSFAQDMRAERNLRKAWKNKSIEKVNTRQLATARSVSYWNYTDTVFPNETLLRLTNLESVYLVGRTMERGPKFKYIPKPPIRLRIDTVKLQELGHLKYVSLMHFDLSAAPVGFSSIDGLEGLSMVMCNLDSLPTDIGRMRNLRALALEVNYLQSLPPEVAELDSLRSIDLSNDHFRELPVELAGCASLERIYLTNDEGGRSLENGYELEYSRVGRHCPYPLCANHIDLVSAVPDLKVLLAGPRLQFISLHARDHRTPKTVKAELGSKKIRFSGPAPFMGWPFDLPVPSDPDQLNCICASKSY